jgi:hypothetical protein
MFGWSIIAAVVSMLLSPSFGQTNGGQGANREIQQRINRELRHLNDVQSAFGIFPESLADARKPDQDGGGNTIPWPSWDTGVVVADVDPDSPADQAGLKANDIVVNWGVAKTSAVSDVLTLAGRESPGNIVSIRFFRFNQDNSTWVDSTAKLVIPKLPPPTTRPEAKPIPNFDAEYMKSHAQVQRWEYGILTFSTSKLDDSSRVQWTDDHNSISAGFNFEIYQQMGGKSTGGGDAPLFNLLGQHGWEFVQRYEAPESFRSGDVIMIFKRPL